MCKTAGGTGIQIQHYHFLILSSSIKSNRISNFTAFFGTGSSLIANQTLREENITDGVTMLVVIK